MSGFASASTSAAPSPTSCCSAPTAAAHQEGLLQRRRLRARHRRGAGRGVRASRHRRRRDRGGPPRHHGRLQRHPGAQGRPTGLITTGASATCWRSARCACRASTTSPGRSRRRWSSATCARSSTSAWMPGATPGCPANSSLSLRKRERILAATGHLPAETVRGGGHAWPCPRRGCGVGARAAAVRLVGDGWVRAAGRFPRASCRSSESHGAGAPFNGEVGPGTAIRISTGAVVPAGADAVVPIERVGVSEVSAGREVVNVPETQAGAHIRRAWRGRPRRADSPPRRMQVGPARSACSRRWASRRSPARGSHGSRSSPPAMSCAPGEPLRAPVRSTTPTGSDPAPRPRWPEPPSSHATLATKRATTSTLRAAVESADVICISGWRVGRAA